MGPISQGGFDQVRTVVEKHEISEKKAAYAPNISPSSQEPSSPAEDAQSEAYKQYWKKYERKNAGSNLSMPTSSETTSPGASSESPSTSHAAASAPDSETGITPDCKRKLQLEGQVIVDCFDLAGSGLTPKYTWYHHNT